MNTEKGPVIDSASTNGAANGPDGHFSSDTGTSQESIANPVAVSGNSLFEDHKGKLAVGAAAMLGLAIFYKWKEHRLAKDDPEEYQRLRKIKTLVHETDKSAASVGNTQQTQL